MGNWTVYKHTLPDGRVYIGITALSPNDRWRNGFGYITQHSFFKHIVEVGWSNIKHEIIASGITEKTARLLEKNLIMQFKEQAINKQHHFKITPISWTHLPIINDEIRDRKIKFRGMNDCWLDRVRYENTIPFDWVIYDTYIEFRYAIDNSSELYYVTVEVDIPNNITYSKLFSYLDDLDFERFSKNAKRNDLNIMLRKIMNQSQIVV